MKSALIAVVTLLAAGADAREVLVDPDGLSPQDALRQVREERGGGDAAGMRTIRVRGRIPLKETLVLTPADSNIRLVGEDGAALVGGEDLKDWTDEGDGTWSWTALARLRQQAKSSAEARLTSPIGICYTSTCCKEVPANAAYATSVAMAIGWRVRKK